MHALQQQLLTHIQTNEAAETIAEDIRGLEQNNLSKNFTNDEGDTPLHLACLNQNFEIVDCLLKDDEFKKQLDAKNKLGNNPLHRLCANKHQKLIVPSSVVPQQENELQPCKLIELLTLLLTNKPGLVYQMNANGETPLHFACCYMGHNPEFIEALLRQGGEYIINNMSGNYIGLDTNTMITPLLFAVQYANIDTLKILLSNGANPLDQMQLIRLKIDNVGLHNKISDLTILNLIGKRGDKEAIAKAIFPLIPALALWSLSCSSTGSPAALAPYLSQELALWEILDYFRTKATDKKTSLENFNARMDDFKQLLQTAIVDINENKNPGETTLKQICEPYLNSALATENHKAIKKTGSRFATDDRYIKHRDKFLTQPLTAVQARWKEFENYLESMVADGKMSAKRVAGAMLTAIKSPAPVANNIISNNNNHSN